jgi:hypothetical protein
MDTGYVLAYHNKFKDLDWRMQPSLLGDTSDTSESMKDTGGMKGESVLAPFNASRMMDDTLTLDSAGGIRNYLNKKFDIGSNLSTEDFGQSESLHEASDVARDHLATAYYMPNKKEAVAELFGEGGQLRAMLENTESQLNENSGFVGSDGATSGDLAWGSTMKMIEMINPDALKKYPKQKAMLDQIQADQRIQDVNRHYEEQLKQLGM